MLNKILKGSAWPDCLEQQGSGLCNSRVTQVLFLHDSLPTKKTLRLITEGSCAKVINLLSRIDSVSQILLKKLRGEEKGNISSIKVKILVFTSIKQGSCFHSHEPPEVQTLRTASWDFSTWKDNLKQVSVSSWKSLKVRTAEGAAGLKWGASAQQQGLPQMQYKAVGYTRFGCSVCCVQVL